MDKSYWLEIEVYGIEAVKQIYDFLRRTPGDYIRIDIFDSGYVISSFWRDKEELEDAVATLKNSFPRVNIYINTESV